MLSFWYKHCERVTSTGVYIRELDGLRFLALLMVFLLHLNHAVLSHPGVEASLSSGQHSIVAALEFGALGVQVFFCISGFILGLPFARSALLASNPISLKTFYFRRLTRLEPPLIIHVTIMLVIYVVFVGKPFAELLPHYGATVTYLHSHVFGYPSPLNPMTWSLEVEAQFYLCTPLLCLVFRIQNLALRRGLILAAMVAFGMVADLMPRTLLPAQLPFFLGGFLLADIYLLDWKRDPKSSLWGDLLAILSALGFALVCAWHKQMPLFVNSVAALMIFIFFYAVFRSVFFRRLFTNRLLSTTGGMCYTFYLYHLAVVTTCSRFLQPRFTDSGYFEIFLIYLVIIGAANLVICSILFVLFERPFMKWRPKAGNWLNGIINRPAKGADL